MPGLWGPDATVTYDWCEPNYAFTPYVAELFNSLSSIPVVLAGAYLLRVTTRRFSLASLLLMGVGVGSALFHGTLLGWAQALDELPMLWITLIMLYLAVTVDPALDRAYGTPLACGLLAVGCTTSVLYMQGGFAFFIATYVSAVGLIVVQTLRSSVGSLAASHARAAVLFYVGGALLFWVPEQILCGNRLEVGHPSVTQRLPLHALFHLTSAVGPVFWLTFVAFETLRRRGGKPAVVYVGAPELCGFPAPVVVTVSQP